MACGQGTKGQMLLDYKARCTLPKYNVSVVPTRIFLPPFGAHEKEIRHFADIPRLRALSGQKSPFAPYIFIRDNGTAMGTGENESKVLRSGESTSKIIETMEAVQDASKGAQGVVLNPFAAQLLRDEGGIKEYAPIFGWIAYTREATARGNAVLEWTLGHPKGAVGGGGVQYCAFNPASMRRELRAVSQNPTQDPYALLDSGGESAPAVKTAPNGVFYSQGADWAGWSLPNRVDDAFQTLFPALLRLGGEPLYFEGATLFINNAWQHILLQVAEVKGKLSGLLTDDMAYLENEASKILDYPSVEGTVSGDKRMLGGLYASAIDDPRVICAGFDVAGRGSREFSTLYYSPSKLFVLKGISDPNAMLAYDDQAQHIKSITQGITDGDYFFGGIWSFNIMHSHTFRGHVRGYFERRGILGLCIAMDKESNCVHEWAMNRHFENLLPGEFRGYGNLKITGRFRMEVDETIPFAKVAVDEISSVEFIKKRLEW
ncbi:MAG: hypothetical protein WC263_04710 [Candidatus Micrarchaeia archaeon]